MKKIFNNLGYAKKHAELTGMHIEFVNGQYIVFTKQPNVDTTADITVIYEEVDTPKKAKKKNS